MTQCFLPRARQQCLRERNCPLPATANSLDGLVLMVPSTPSRATVVTVFRGWYVFALTLSRSPCLAPSSENYSKYRCCDCSIHTHGHACDSCRMETADHTFKIRSNVKKKPGKITYPYSPFATPVARAGGLTNDRNSREFRMRS